jgi:hypothetical protein
MENRDLVAVRIVSIYYVLWSGHPVPWGMISANMDPENRTSRLDDVTGNVDTALGYRTSSCSISDQTSG